MLATVKERDDRRLVHQDLVRLAQEIDPHFLVQHMPGFLDQFQAGLARPPSALADVTGYRKATGIGPAGKRRQEVQMGRILLQPSREWRPVHHLTRDLDPQVFLPVCLQVLGDRRIDRRHAQRLQGGKASAGGMAGGG